jgi:hypothetical protein
MVMNDSGVLETWGSNAEPDYTFQELHNRLLELPNLDANIQSDDYNSAVYDILYDIWLGMEYLARKLKDK